MPAAALALLLMQAAPPEADPSFWVKRPNFDALRPHFPQQALEAGVEGGALVACEVAGDGRLRKCAVEREDPPGYGLGEAALKATPFFQARPGAAGAKVRLPIGFRINPKDAFISVKAEGGWKVLQQPWDWERLYPLKARQQKVSGEARVECRPNEKRRIICTVLAETPEGQGFGKAALDLQGKLLMAPPPGATEKVVRMTVKFRPPRAE
ncbi:energy transducer TonB [Phenylobacterium sp.]|uniref:energy transducer TonB family protein n=1 Tax=Phenylobacterium sp. TaxID=1871053 RepID=UPI002F94F948